MRTSILRRSCITAALLAATVTTTANAADTVTFELIENARSANDMSPDGRWIVGTTADDGTPYLLDTITGVMLLLPAPATDAVAVSDDGTVVLGNMPDPDTGDQVACIWTQASNTWQSLGYLPDALSCPSRSSGYELSADGSVAVGLSWDGCNGRGFRWTSEDGMIELKPVANGGNRASVVSADGSLIAGFAQGSFSRTPTYWTWDGKLGEGSLLDPPDGDALGEIQGMSDDGSILLGEWNGDASMWTYPGLVRTTIGNGTMIPGWTGIPQDISANGTIVGFDILGGNRRGWILPNGVGTQTDLKNYVEGHGGVVPDGLLLEVCQAISADGRRIIGHGFSQEAWLVTIERDCTADIAPLGGDGITGLDDLLEVIAEWGQCDGCAADFLPEGGDGEVGLDELLAVIAGWGTCPGVEGACCLDDSCVQATEADCINAGGSFLGNYVPCSVFACENNDLCADAIDINAYINGDPVIGDNSTATPGPGTADTELPANSPTCHFDSNPQVAHSTVWYKFNAPENGRITFSICNVQSVFTDSTFALYDGACGALIEIACDEDGCDGEWPYYSRLVMTDLTPNKQYKLCVMNAGGTLYSVPGPFELTVTSN